MLCGINDDMRLGCGQPIAQDREYRCVDCDVIFCRACLRKHCGKKDRTRLSGLRLRDLTEEEIARLPVETRGTTLWLRSHGFDTSWSDARTVRVLVVPEDMVGEARRLLDLLKDMGVRVFPPGSFPDAPTLVAVWRPCGGSGMLLLRNVVGAEFP